MTFRYLKSSFWFLFGAIWAAVGTILVVAGMAAGLAQRRLETRGEHTDATVIRTYTTTDDDGGTRYKLEVSYRDRRGVLYRREVGVDRSDFETLHVGKDVEIVYDPVAPEDASLATALETPWWTWTAVSVVFAGAFAGVGWFLVMRELRRARSRVALLKDGVRISGEVVGLEPDRTTRVNGRHPWSVVYAFTGPDGVRRRGTSVPLPRGMEERFRERSVILVACDPENPDRHEPDIFGVLSSTE